MEIIRTVNVLLFIIAEDECDNFVFENVKVQIIQISSLNCVVISVLEMIIFYLVYFGSLCVGFL
jgi:hypothetical protein